MIQHLTKLLLLALLLLPIKVHAQTKNHNPRVTQWLLTIGKLWKNANIEDQSLLLRRILQQSQKHPSDIRSSCQTLLQNEKDPKLLQLWQTLNSQSPHSNPFQTKTNSSIETLLQKHDDGSPLEQAARYLLFIRLLDKNTTKLGKLIPELLQQHPQHPFLLLQNNSLKLQAKWRNSRKLFLAILPPKKITALKRAKIAQNFQMTQFGRRGQPTTTKHTEWQNAWILLQTDSSVTLLHDNLRTQIHHKKIPKHHIQTLENEIWERLSSSIKPKKHSFPSLTTQFSLPTETLLIAYYAHLCKRPSLALRLREYAELAFKKLKLQGSLDQNAAQELSKTLNRTLDSFLISKPRKQTLAWLSKVQRSLKNTPIANRAHTLKPLLESLTKDPKPPLGYSKQQRLLRALYDMRDQTVSHTMIDSNSFLTQSFPAFQTLRELGWFSIPQLIELLDDPRPTRAYTQWKTFPPNILNHGQVAKLYLNAILGLPLESLIKSDPKASNDSFKKAAQAWWQNNQQKDLITFRIEQLQGPNSHQPHALLLDLLHKAKTRAAIKHKLRDLFSKETRPDVLLEWLEILTPYKDLQFDPKIVQILKTNNLTLVRKATKLLLEIQKNPKGIPFLEQQLAIKPSPHNDQDIEDSLLLLHKHNSNKHLQLAQFHLLNMARRNHYPEDYLSQLPDSPPLRSLLQKIAQVSRTPFPPQDKDDKSSSLSFEDEYKDFGPQDQAAIQLAKLLKIKEATLFPEKTKKSPKARDIQIKKLLTKN